MTQNIGYLLAKIFIAFASAFFLVAIYVEYKHYNQLPYGKTGIRYDILGALSIGLSLFVLLVTENGFSWDALGVSVGLASVLAISLKINSMIRIKTAASSYKRTGSLSPLPSIIKLINIIINKTPDDPDSDIESKNKE